MYPLPFPAFSSQPLRSAFLGSVGLLPALVHQKGTLRPLPRLPWALCSGHLGACPVEPLNPQHFLASHSLLFPLPHPSPARRGSPVLLVGCQAQEWQRQTNILRCQKPVSGQRGCPPHPCFSLLTSTCCPLPHGCQGKNTLPFLGLLGARVGWAARPVCSLRELGEAVGFLGVALAYLPGPAAGIRVSPRLLGLGTGRQ